MQTGFFTKKQVGVEQKPAKRQSSVRKTAKPEVVHDLPPRLVVAVPAETKTVKLQKASTGERPIAVMDIECYVNYFLVKFRRPDGESTLAFEQVDELGAILDKAGIRAILAAYEIVTYNGIHFDLPVLNYALAGHTNAEIKAAADDLIKNEVKTYKFEAKHGLKPLVCDHVDLSPLCPIMTGLKLMGARLHSEIVRELPYAEASRLSEGQMDAVSEYCGNDLAVTDMLAADLGEDIQLRRVLGKRYGIDLRSRSDAQIAEDIFKAEMLAKTGYELRRPREVHTVEFFYKVPDFVAFVDPRLNVVLDMLATNKFTAKPVNKGIGMPEPLDDLKIELGNSVYRMGIGGLHSSEKTAFHVADTEAELWDFDVTSYYPSIILQCGLVPPNVGEVFTEIYREIVDERVKAKRGGDKVKADSMKITANGTFGKLGSPWSVLYAPELMIQVTVTGQLAVLMLIDRLEHHGIAVVSGNTDGVVVKPRRDQVDLMRAVVTRWERTTGFAMEGTQYAGLWSRDVNNYVAIGVDGKIKTKGCFAYGSRRKNPDVDICTDAIMEYLKTGKSVEETIRGCEDIRKFISVRQVKGGAVKGGEYVGKVVRWYYSTEETGFIAYKTNGNKVPQTDGARAVMTLPDRLPADIDYDWYVRKCCSLFY